MCLGLGAVLEGLSLRDVAQERRGGGAVVVDLFTKKKRRIFFVKPWASVIFFWVLVLWDGEREKSALLFTTCMEENF